MDPAFNTCSSCQFPNPRAFRACARCGRSLIDSSPLVAGRVYLTDETVVQEIPPDMDLDDLELEELVIPEGGAPDSLPPTAAEDVEPPMIGQEEASAAIRTGIETAIRTGKTTLVALEGGRGSGKTRLLFHAAELAAHLVEDLRVVYGSCRAEGGDAYNAPFSRMLFELFGVTPSFSPSAVRAAMSTEVSQTLQSTDAALVTETTHLLGYVAGIPFPDSPFVSKREGAEVLAKRGGRALRRFFEAAASKRPIVLLLDNMHGAEADGWDLLAELMDIERPLAIVITGDAPVAQKAEQLRAVGGVAVGPIAPFREEHVAAMLKVLVPTLVEMPEPVVSALTHRSSGIPGAIRELIFALVEARLFFKDPSGMVRADLSQLSTGALPVTTHDAILARLARLDALERATLDRASVVGEVFWERAALAQMRAERGSPSAEVKPADIWANDHDARALAASLQRLREKGFIEAIEDSEVPYDREYRFLHGETRDLLYRQQPEDLRRDRHRTIAHWMSLHTELTAHGVARRIAPHLEKAGLDAQAGRAYLEAAREEHSKMHTQTALRYAEKALSLIEEGELNKRLEALHTYGSLLTVTGRYEEAQASFTEMLSLAWRLGARGKAGAALNRIARIHRQKGDHSEAEVLLARALILFRESGDIRGVAATLDDLAQVELQRGDLDRALAAASEALDIRRSHQDPRGEAVSLSTLGKIELSRGDLESALSFLQAGLAIQESIGDRRGVMMTYNSLGIVAHERGDFESARGCWQAALVEARKMADRHVQSMLLNNLGESHLESGDADKAVELLTDARVVAHELKERRTMAEVERNLGLARLRRGDDGAEETLVRALKMAEEYGALLAVGLAHRAIGQLRAQTLFDDKGEISKRAEESFLASIDTFREIGDEKEAARSLALLGYHLVERGDIESARERLKEARAIMRRLGLGGADKVNQTLLELL